MTSDNIYLDSIKVDLSDNLNNKIEKYYKNYHDDKVFRKKMTELFKDMNNEYKKKGRVQIILHIIQLLNEYSELIYKNNYDKYINFAKAIKIKLVELKKTKELKVPCNNFLNKYYPENNNNNNNKYKYVCKAYTLCNRRCKNKININISNNLCSIHNKIKKTQNE